MNLVNEVLVENFVEDEDDFNNFISKPITNGKNMILQYMYIIFLIFVSILCSYSRILCQWSLGLHV